MFGHILWGCSLNLRPEKIGLILMVGTSNQSDPENPIDIMLTSGEAYLGGLSLSILVNGGYNHSYYHHQ